MVRRTPAWPVGLLSTATMDEAIGLLDGLINPLLRSSSICRCISGFSTAEIRYSLSLLGLKSGVTTILCSTYGQNPGFSAKQSGNSFNNCKSSFLLLSLKCCNLSASSLEVRSSVTRLSLVAKFDYCNCDAATSLILCAILPLPTCNCVGRSSSLIESTSPNVRSSYIKEPP